MRSFWSACFGLLCVLGIFTGIGLGLNELPQTDTYVPREFERMRTVPVANAYEIARRMDAEEKTQDRSVIPPYLFSCTLGENRLTRPPYYDENFPDHTTYGFIEVPEFPAPTLQDPTFVDPRSLTTICIHCKASAQNDHVRRIPPRMPAAATRSGHCKVRFDVDTDGIPQNIVTPYCSEALFSAPTIASIRKWKYTPRRVDGESVSFEVETIVRYKLIDEDGNVIPEAQ